MVTSITGCQGCEQQGNPGNKELSVMTSGGSEGFASNSRAVGEGYSAKSARQSSSPEYKGIDHKGTVGPSSAAGEDLPQTAKRHETIDDENTSFYTNPSSVETLRSRLLLDADFAAEVTRVVPPSLGNKVWHVVVTCSYAQGRTFDLRVVDRKSGRVLYQVGPKNVTRNIEDIVFEITMARIEITSVSFQVRERETDKIVDQWNPE
ncbi:MAG: hypothetical protein N2111_14365 [Candidatus Sumerlaeaceae bacterium]|nr:hypothetical protein [Candidatus Sumerlaeaceae bacterium]